MVTSVLAAMIGVAAAGPAGSQPIELRAMVIELTVDAQGAAQGCNVIESTGMPSLDTLACTMELMRRGAKVERGKLVSGDSPPAVDASGKPVTTPQRFHAAMVRFDNGSAQLAKPPEARARAAFARIHPGGRRGALIAEAYRKRDGARTCAFFAPRLVSRFDPAHCSRAVESQEMAGERKGDGGALVWRNAVLAPEEL